jgi:hypothetical protein
MRQASAASLIAAALILVPATAAAGQKASGKENMNLAANTKADMNAVEQMVRQYYRTIEMQPYDEAAVSEIFTDDYRNYPPHPAPPGASAKQATLGLIKMLSQGFPDARRNLLIVEPLGQDRVLAYFSFEGTHTGNFLGYAPSGKKVTFVGVDIFKVRDGKFIENWHVEDVSKLLEQLSGK